MSEAERKRSNGQGTRRLRIVDAGNKRSWKEGNEGLMSVSESTVLIDRRMSSRACSSCSSTSSSSIPCDDAKATHVRPKTADTSPSLMVMLASSLTRFCLGLSALFLDTRRSSAAVRRARANSPRPRRKKSFSICSISKTLVTGRSFCSAFWDMESRMAPMAAEKLVGLRGKSRDERCARWSGSRASSGATALEEPRVKDNGRSRM